MQQSAKPKPDYARLAGHLAGRTDRTVTLTFGELERLLGASLPDDAYDRRDWWDGGASKLRPHTRAWREAGWRLEAVDVLGRMVTFVRQ